MIELIGISPRWAVGSIRVDVFISWILVCISSISFEVLVNCGKWEHFKPSRGLRQRDPLRDKGGLKYLRMGRKATVGTRIWKVK